jgi:PAS domain S-box-containing protein
MFIAHEIIFSNKSDVPRRPGGASDVLFFIAPLIAAYKAGLAGYAPVHMQRKTVAPCLFLILLIIFYYFPAITGMAADPAPLKEITVVLDDNYPPFIFRDENNHPQGILVDEWRLWEKKTGIKVGLRGMDWDKAQKTMAEGNAQVIDTIFFTEKRAKTLAFSAPYASIDVPIFFHRNISGIKDVKSLLGFTIGVKAGDACIDFLKKHGIHTLREYPSYESIVRDAAAQNIKVFCIDAPPAQYFLYKMNIEQQYRNTAPLYTGQFHRAVHKERKDLLAAVEEGFARISGREHEEIEKRWRGSPIGLPHDWTYLLYLMGALVILGAVLLLWNHTLRRKVTQKTVQLQEAIEALGKSEDKYRLLVENAEEAILIAQDGFLKYVNPITVKMLGYSMEALTSMPFVELIHQDDRKKLFEAHIRRLKGEEHQPVHQFRFLTSDGSVRWADSRSVTIPWEGKPATLNFITDVTERKKADEEHQHGIERIRKALGATVQAMAMTVEARDPYTAGHQHRVSDLARAIATEMDLPSHQIDGVRMASMIHDIGKISVPAEILSKPTKLSEIEFSLIKIHSQSGYDILKDIDFPWPIARIVLEHHERRDGSGYPNGLTGDKLLMESRILAVADVVESMSSHRPYRASLGLDPALKEITVNRGVLYDPEVVDACLRLFNEKGYTVVD